MMVGQNTFKYNKLEKIASICRQIANSTNAQLVLHLDHGASYEQVIQCLRNGFTSVMIDGSRLPLKENIRVTKEVTRAAHTVGVSVEAELGAIGGTEDGMTAKANLVNVDDARCFLEEVTVEALAIGIGNAHGIYKSTPNLAFPDAGTCSDWASTALAWAVERGILNGMDGRLAPGGTATRAQAAAMLTRYLQ